MKKIIFPALVSICLATPALADSSQNTRDLSGALSQPAARLSAVGGSVVALPMMSVGEVGDSMLKGSFELMVRSSGNDPFNITDRSVVTQRSPAEAMEEDARADAGADQ